MASSTFATYVASLAVMHDVEGLFELYKRYPRQRDDIEKIVPFLAEELVLDLEGNNSFQNLLRLHDEREADRICEEGPEYCLKYFAGKGNLTAVKLQIRRGATNFIEGIEAAGKTGSIPMLKYFLDQGVPKEELRRVFPGAKLNDRQELLAWLQSQGVNTKQRLPPYKYALNSLGDGSVDEMRRLIHEYKLSMVQLFDLIVTSGNLDTLKYFLSIYEPENPNELDWLRWFDIATKNGRGDIVKFLFEQGVDDINEGLLGAAQANDIPLMQFFLEKGANNIAQAFQFAARKGNLEAVKYLFSTDTKKVLSQVNLNTALEHAIWSGKRSLADFLLNIGAVLPKTAAKTIDPDYHPLLREYVKNKLAEKV